MIKLPWLKRTYWSVFLPKTLGRLFQIPGRMFFLTGRVFGLKTSGRVFFIKNSRPNVLKHPAGCLNFKHLPGHFTNTFEIWSWNYFTTYLMVFIFLCFWKLTRFLSFRGTCNYLTTATVRISYGEKGVVNLAVELPT